MKSEHQFLVEERISCYIVTLPHAWPVCRAHKGSTLGARNVIGQWHQSMAAWHVRKCLCWTEQSCNCFRSFDPHVRDGTQQGRSGGRSPIVMASTNCRCIVTVFRSVCVGCNILDIPTLSTWNFRFRTWASCIMILSIPRLEMVTGIQGNPRWSSNDSFQTARLQRNLIFKINFKVKVNFKIEMQRWVAWTLGMTKSVCRHFRSINTATQRLATDKERKRPGLGQITWWIMDKKNEGPFGGKNCTEIEK